MEPAYDRQWPVVRGDDQSRLYEFLADDEVTPLDLTGRTYTWSIAPDRGKTPVLTGSAVVVDAAAGEVQINLTDTQTATLTEGRYAYDLVEFVGATEVTVVLGVVHMVGRVTT